MSNLGSRTNIARRAPTFALPAQLGIGQIPPPCCGFSNDLGTIANNPATPTPEGRVAYQFFSSGVPCTGDMAVTATVVTWDTDNVSGDNSLQLDVRMSTTSPYSADFTIEDIGGTANAHHRIGTLLGVPIATVDLAKPVPGDVFYLSIVGDAVTAKKNGSTILSGTISGIVMPTSPQPVADAACLASGSGAGPYEVRATASFESFC